MNTKKIDKGFDYLMIFIVLGMVLLCLIPVLNVASTSLSSREAILNNKVWIFPVDFTWSSYKSVFQDKTMIHSLVYSAILTAGCTIFNLAMTILCAYPLTKKKLKGRRTFMTLIIITMYFSGGMIPDYMLVKNLHLLNSVWALVLPGAISVFNMIILKSFFMGIPESLEESAFLDGASDWVILTRIVLPLSTPVLATLALFYAVGRWNGFMDALMYVSNPKLEPIQLKLYKIIFNNSSLEIAQTEGAKLDTSTTAESIKAACVMFATVPIIMIYPWLQKYFISGMMVGAVKG
jgi:putative aldouronate transport system permease protein